jgi:serine/threonine-protein kinase
MVWQKYVQVSEHFAEVLKKMLESSVRHRYQVAGDILRALDLEPYLDSLAQGLATKPNNPTPNSKSQLYYSGDIGTPSSGSTPSTATTKLAMAIRARRERKLQSGAFTSAADRANPPLPSQRPSTTSLHSQGFTAGKAKTPAKLDANALLAAYMKGRRDFASQDLSGLNLQKVDLSGGIFHQSKLGRTNFQGADLSNADFGRASLIRVNFRDANLGRAYLSYADLEGADLRGADLSFAYLNNANLKGANLCGANLSNAKITEEQLAHAKINWATILPSGKRGFW